MKLRTKNKIVIGDPQMGADLEIKTNGRAYTIQVLFEKWNSKVWILVNAPH